MKSILAFLVVVLAACSSGDTAQIEVTRIKEIDVTVEVPVEVTRQVEVTREVVVEVTAAPTSVPQDFVFLELEGEGGGGLVTDNFEWPECQKAVFIAEKSVRDNFAAYAVNADTGDDWLIFNMLDENHSEELQPLLGGTYYIELEYVPSGPWKVTGICRD